MAWKFPFNVLEAMRKPLLRDCGAGLLAGLAMWQTPFFLNVISRTSYVGGSLVLCSFLLQRHAIGVGCRPKFAQCSQLLMSVDFRTPFTNRKIRKSLPSPNPDPLNSTAPLGSASPAFVFTQTSVCPFTKHTRPPRSPPAVGLPKFPHRGVHCSLRNIQRNGDFKRHD